MTLTLDLAQACAATYAAGAKPQWENPARLVHAYLMPVEGKPCIAWEGTTDFQEWLVDFMAFELPMFDHMALGPVHLGLALDVLSIHDSIIGWLKGQGWPEYYNTGHSKGAGEALIFAGIMKTVGHPPVQTAAFEAPRVGSPIMRDYLADQPILQTETQNVHGKDIVTQVPFGPTWVDMREPQLLTVPDGYDLATKHRIPAVIEALS